MTIADFARASTFRITISCTLAFIGALLILSAAFYFGGAALWREEIRETVAEEYQDVSAAYDTGGAGRRPGADRGARRSGHR